MLASTLGRLWVAIDDLNRDIPGELAAVEDAQSTLILLGLLRNARKELQLVESFAERAAAERMTDNNFEALGVRATRRQTAEKEVWDHEGLATAVLVSAIVDENGELPSEEAQLVASNVKAALMRCATVSRWRIKELEKARIDVPNFRDRIPGRFTVEVTLGEGAEAA
jgi:N-acetylglutamate synthase/N-acetylornithine aminotransferase